MRKGEMQMKVKNLFKVKKKCANESSESRTNRLATQSQYQRQKIANELTQRQYQKENIKNGSADHIRQERLANQRQHQNEKNAYSATITNAIRKFHATVQSTFALY